MNKNNPINSKIALKVTNLWDV